MSEEKNKEVAEVKVPINADGSFDFQNQIQLVNAAKLMIKTKHAPDHLIREGYPAVAAALLFCRQYGLSQAAMNHLAWIKGKLAPYGSLYTAIAEKHPKFGEKREFFVDADCLEICVKNKNLRSIPYAAVVQIRKKGEQHWTEYYFSMDDAEQAGLLNPTKRSGEKNLDSPWVKYVKDMLKHRARRRALDAEYASAIQGLEYFEEIAYEKSFIEPKDVTPSADLDDLKNDLEQEVSDENNFTAAVEVING